MAHTNETRRNAGANLTATSRSAFNDELARLDELRKLQEDEADFLTTEGQGVAASADITLGDELDLENLSEEEKLRRSQGRIENTGLFL